MVDQTNTLNANMAVLIAAITNLTLAVHEHIRICNAAFPTMDVPDIAPTEALSEMSLNPSPPANSGLSTPNASQSTGDPSNIVRECLAEMEGPGTGPWYIVTVGSEPGVYQHIEQVSHLTSGISGNAHKKHTSKASAMEAYERAWNLGAVRRVV